MIYIVTGDQRPLLDRQIEEIVHKELTDVNDFTLVKYDLEETPLASVVDDAITYPFGYENKVIVLSNPYFLMKESKKVSLEFEQTFEEFEEYLENQSDFTTIIFRVLGKLDQKDKFNKKLVGKSNLITLKEIGKYEWLQLVKQKVTEQGAGIDNKAAEEILQRVGDDLGRLELEVEKLALCSKKISLELVDALVAPKIEDNVFLFLDSMMDGDVKRSMSIYEDFKNQNMEPTVLISIIASQLRFLYQVAVQQEKGLRQDDIASVLKVHPYRVKLALQRVNKGTPSDVLLGILDQFSKLDIDIKTGQVDRFQAFEIFILRFLQRYN